MISTFGKIKNKLKFCNFVLIDKDGRVRSGVDKNNNVVGVYDGTNEAQMKELINDIKVLMAEYKRPTKEDEK